MEWNVLYVQLLIEDLVQYEAGAAFFLHHVCMLQHENLSNNLTYVNVVYGLNFEDKDFCHASENSQGSVLRNLSWGYREITDLK